MPATVELPCPNCEKPLKVPETVFGKKIKCKHCGHAFVVEDPDDAPARPAKGKAAVKPSKPGGAAVKAKPKEESKKEEPKKEQPAPYKFQDDDDDDDGGKPNPIAVIAEEEVARCPHCAKELDPPDAVVCIHCGFNNVTRVKADSKKVWAPDASDWINHLWPGIMAAVMCIGIIVVDIICIVNMREWMTGSFLEKEELGADGRKKFYIAPGAFIALIIALDIMPVIGLAYFAVQRLAIHYMPPERVKK
jgi:DNA-directed RNA polymerase subunit RPC12/RpoP